MSRGDFWGAELSLAERPGGQTRFLLSAAGGRYEGAAAVRLGVAGQFVLRPAARAGVSLYAGLGVAFAGASGARGAAYLTAMLGLEAAPARPQGWYAELGLGGGVRLAGGWRWRRFPSWW